MSQDWFEEITEKVYRRYSESAWLDIPSDEYAKACLAEYHRALVREVKRLSTTHPAGLSIEDVLALLAKQKGRTR